ncbi:hypothetical protein [Macrococcus armenti]|uniref:hypothetical protein n=1 Tax=Macrococcus armenti TaxID=2875764 RepID=UPI001CD48C6F|nr:hypothetical protein [Macrococcus armenti]UBH10105.1 hypothetical protein LAU38_07410 [Macrococcus armenti]
MKPGKKPKTYYLFEAQFNHLYEIGYYELAELLNIHFTGVSRYLKNNNLIKSINCYLLDHKPTVSEKRRMIAALEYKDELWRESRLENLYISNKGRFRAKTKRGWRYYFPYKFKNTIQIKYKSKEYKANRLVYETWNGNIPPEHCVYAKNGITHEVEASNLGIATREKLGRLTGYKSKSKEVLLLDDKGNVIDEFRSAREASRKLPISHEAVNNCCNKKFGDYQAGGVYRFVYADNYVKGGA